VKEAHREEERDENAGGDDRDQDENDDLSETVATPHLSSQDLKETGQGSRPLPDEGCAHGKASSREVRRQARRKPLSASTDRRFGTGLTLVAYDLAFFSASTIVLMSIWAGVSAATFGLGGFFYWRSSKSAQRAKVRCLPASLSRSRPITNKIIRAFIVLCGIVDFDLDG